MGRHDKQPARRGWGLLASVALHGALIAGASAVVGPMAEERDVPVEVEVELDGADIMTVTVLATPQPLEALDPWPVAGASGAQHLGELAAPDHDARYGVKGPVDNPDPHVSRVPIDGGRHKRAADPMGMARPSRAQGATAPWGRPNSLGNDARDARGRMWGATLDDAWSRGELALSPSLAIHGFT